MFRVAKALVLCLALVIAHPSTGSACAWPGNQVEWFNAVIPSVADFQSASFAISNLSQTQTLLYRITFEQAEPFASGMECSGTIHGNPTAKCSDIVTLAPGESSDQVIAMAPTYLWRVEVVLIRPTDVPPPMTLLAHAVDGGGGLTSVPIPLVRRSCQ